MNRYLLLIEDHGFTYDALKSQLKNSGWSVYRGRDEDDTDRTLDIAASNGFSFDFIAIDLGLPPLSDSHDIGLKLAIKLRNFFSSTPILAYTSQTPRSFKYGYVLRELLARKVSFIYSRPEDDSLSFSDIVDIASKGFVLLSDTPAGYLSNAIAIAPDPLMNDNYWNVLKLMSQKKTFSEIATELGYSRDTIQKYSDEIKIILNEKYFQEEKIDIKEVVNWYIENHVKYYRE